MDNESLLNAQIFEFIRKILTLGKDFNFSISSWKRTYQHNIDVGSKFPNNSKHLTWLAVDTILDKDQDQNAYLNRIKELELHYLSEGDHIHIQL